MARTHARLEMMLAEAGAALRRGEWQAAEMACRRVVRLDSGHAGAWLNLGVALQEQGRGDEAVKAAARAIAAQADFAEAHANRGMWLQRLGRSAEAEVAARRAIALRPNDSAFRYVLGTILQTQNRPCAAMACFRSVITQHPADADSWANLGCLLEISGDWPEAVAAHRRALRLHGSGEPLVWSNLAVALRAMGAYAAAHSACSVALVLEPALAEAWANFGSILSALGERTAAVTAWQRACWLGLSDAGGLLALQAQNLRHLGEMDAADALSVPLLRLLREGGSRRIHPFTILADSAATRDDQLQAARLYARGLVAACADRSPLAHTIPASPMSHGRRRIAYLSSDFQEHATAVLIAEFSELHNRTDFEIFAYSYGQDDGGPLRQRLRAGFDHFIDCSTWSHQAIATHIHDYAIEIAVDLKGYTQDARPEILITRPAPVQITWLGYPGTLGADWIDYALVDAIVAPPAHQSSFHEHLIYLPDCYQVNDRHRPRPVSGPPRVACGLPESSLVWCCFNSTYKINRAVWNIWMRLLHAVPDSVLWLLEGSVEAKDALRRAAAAQGVAPERLVFAPRWPLAEHLARYLCADLFLDTAPVNAHTTASDALWMGIPVLTLCGDTMAGRVAASLLRAVGLPQLAVFSLTAYEALALELAAAPQQRQALRQQLAATRAVVPLFDTPRFTRHLEQAYHMLWARHVAGEKPCSFSVC